MLNILKAYINICFVKYIRGPVSSEKEGYINKTRFLGTEYSYLVEYSYGDYLEYNVKKELEKLKKNKYLKSCKDKDDFCTQLAKLYIELDFLHPFADGNSRSLREFSRQIAFNAGYYINWDTTINVRDALYQARDEGVNNNDPDKLIQLLSTITSSEG